MKFSVWLCTMMVGLCTWSASGATGPQFRTQDTALAALWQQAENQMALGLGAGDPQLRWWSLRSALATGVDTQGVERALEGSWEGAAGLFWPTLLVEYYQFSGNRMYAKNLASERLGSVMDALAAYEGETSFLEGLESPLTHHLSPSEASAALQLLYWSALNGAATAVDRLELQRKTYADRATELAGQIHAAFRDTESSALRATLESRPSVALNAIALALGFPGVDAEAALAVIRNAVEPPAPAVAPWIIEACYRADYGGDASLGYRVLAWAAQAQGLEPAAAAKGLIVRYVMGLEPHEPGWSVVRFSPGLPIESAGAELTVNAPRGRVRVSWNSERGYIFSAPPGVGLRTNLAEDIPLQASADDVLGTRSLTAEEQRYLESHGWQERVGDAPGVWVSVGEQMLRLIQGGNVLWETRCATAEAGTGSQSGSYRTPLGWHRISDKIGDGAPWGQVFRARQATREIWKPGGDTKEDLVLTRILWLDGEEPGKNKGGDVDSKSRYIYIHGTNAEQRIGEPSSHGCIRLRNDDAIIAYEKIAENTRLLITEP